MSETHIAEELHETGRVIVPDLDVSNQATAGFEISRVLSSIGQPVKFFTQPMIMDVKPQPGFQPASSGGKGFFPMHTDLTFHESPADLFGLLCIQDDSEGGDSFVADGYKVLEKVADDVAALRTQDVAFPTPSHVAGGPVNHNIVSGDAERPTIRFRSDMLVSAEEPVRGLLQRFGDAAQEVIEEMHLKPGELLIVDNRRMLHGRTEITDEDSQRHLLRMYANIPAE